MVIWVHINPHLPYPGKAREIFGTYLFHQALLWHIINQNGKCYIVFTSKRLICALCFPDFKANVIAVNDITEGEDNEMSSTGINADKLCTVNEPSLS